MMAPMIPTRRLRQLPLGALVGLASIGVAGCATGTGAPETAGAPAIGLPVEVLPPGAVKIYLVTANGPWPVWRDTATTADPQAAFDALTQGPQDAERSRGIGSALPTNALGLTATASAGRVDIDLPWTIQAIDPEAVSQMACTAAWAPGIPGNGVPTEILVVFHEPLDQPNEFAVHCGTDAEAKVGPSA